MNTPANAALPSLLETALASRQTLLASLHAEQTDAYRLFHGTVEGAPGLTVDRYGELLLIQTFHQSLDTSAQEAIAEFYHSHFPGLIPIYNDRSQGNSRISNELPDEQLEAAIQPRIAHEIGVSYAIQARHGGQDPWLFLDLRAGRRRVMAEAAGKSVLNLFAYTCGVGTAAAAAGAKEVLNIDFAETSLAVGKQNARLNNLSVRPKYIKSDAFAAMRQLSGIGQPAMVRGKRLPPFPKMEPHQFDLVFLDPPRYAKSMFGVVNLINDYPSVFKPALLCTAEGGILICCNNVAQVEREAWVSQLERSAAKAGRPIHEIEWIQPEADFPSPDQSPPLKMVLLHV